MYLQDVVMETLNRWRSR